MFVYSAKTKSLLLCILFTLLISLLIPFSVVTGEIYIWTDENGVKHASDSSFPRNDNIKTIDSSSSTSDTSEIGPVPANISKQFQNRNEYKKFLQSKYGDPLADERELAKHFSDMESLINDTVRQKERDFFNHIFKGKYRYEDRGRLDKRAQDHLQNQRLILRKNIENEHKQDYESRKQEIEVRKEQYTQELKAFDEYMKAFSMPEKKKKSRQ